MRFELDEAPAIYTSGSQRARIVTERWVSQWVFCPNCGNPQLTQFINNRPLADFFCPSCNDQFELKSQKKGFGAKVMDGAYAVKCERLASDTSPNLMLLNYDLGLASVKEVCVVPKHFFVPEIIEKRKPLAQTARRAGWIGSNILLGRVPDSGRIYLVRNGVAEPKETVLAKWQRTLFLRHENVEARGWLIEVMKCVELIGKPEFEIEDVYAFESGLAALYPNNRNVKPKIRQQLQVLRDSGYLEFVSRGRYRLSSST